MLITALLPTVTSCHVTIDNCDVIMTRLYRPQTAICPVITGHCRTWHLLLCDASIGKMNHETMNAFHKRFYLCCIHHIGTADKHYVSHNKVHKGRLSSNGHHSPCSRILRKTLPGLKVLQRDSHTTRGCWASKRHKSGSQMK